ARAEIAELEQLLERLIALIETQQRLNGDTARLARKLPGRSSLEIGAEQNETAAKTRTWDGALPPSVPQAATYVGDAATQMILAGNELGVARPVEARPPQDEALAN